MEISLAGGKFCNKHALTPLLNRVTSLGHDHWQLFLQDEENSPMPTKSFSEQFRDINPPCNLTFCYTMFLSTTDLMYQSWMIGKRLMTVWLIYSSRLFLFHFRRERDIEIPQPTDAVGGRYWTLTNFGIFFSCSRIGKTMSLLKFLPQGEMKPLTSKSLHWWLEKPQIYKEADWDSSLVQEHTLLWNKK